MGGGQAETQGLRRPRDDRAHRPQRRPRTAGGRVERSPGRSHCGPAPGTGAVTDETKRELLALLEEKQRRQDLAVYAAQALSIRTKSGRVERFGFNRAQ